MGITWEQADTAIAAARAIALERGESVSLAIVDTGGNLVGFSRMDGANLMTIDTAIGKAYTAISIGSDTIELNPYIQPGQPLFGTNLMLAGSRSVVPYAGGVVIRSAGELLGALGVSGAGQSRTDHEIGTAAAATLRPRPEH